VEDISEAKPDKIITETVTATIKHEVADRIATQAYNVGPLELCVFHKHHDGIKHLLTEMKQSSVLSSLGAGVTALFIACWNNDVTTAKLLIDAGIDVNRAEIHHQLTPLHVAVARGSGSLIKILLSAGCDRFAADTSGRTAIYFAFKHQQMRIAKQILAHKSNNAAPATNDTKDVGRSLAPPVALISAAAFERLLDDKEEDLVRLVVSSGYSVDTPLLCGCSPLLQMLGDTNITMAKLLLDLGASPLGHACKSVKWNWHRANYTAYHYAVQNPDLLPVLRRLLDNIELCELSVRDSPAHPLHIAILNRNQKALAYILKRYEEAGSSKLSSSRSQQSLSEPFKAIVFDADDQVVQTNGERGTSAPKVEPQESRQEPLDAKGTSLDTHDDNEWWSWGLPKPSQPTKPSDAVESDDDLWPTTRKKKHKQKLKQAQKAMREAEQNTDANETHHGQEPRSLATNAGPCKSLLLRAVLDRSIVKTNTYAEFFLSKDVSIKTIPPGRPLHITAHIGYLDAVPLLLEAGAVMGAVDEKLQTPLHYAVASRDLDMVRLLIDHGANVNARDRTGSSVAHYSCVQGGEIEILRMLYTAGADFCSRDNEGRTPLHIACRESKSDVVHYLSSLGLDHTAKDFRGTTPLDLIVHIGLNRPLAFVLSFLSGHSDLPPSKYILAQVWQDAKPTELRQIAKRLPQEHLALYANAYSREAGGTPLYLAASAGQVQICDMLREYGALVNLEGGLEGTPLMAACYHGRLEAVKCLVRAGAEISYLTEQKLVVSAIDAAKHFLDIVRWLLVGRYTEQRFLTRDQEQEVIKACPARTQWRHDSLKVVLRGNWAAYSHSIMQHVSRSFICSGGGYCEAME
jgi:ankyrin repeat protein